MADEPPKQERDTIRNTPDRPPGRDVMDSQQIRMVLALCGSLLLFTLAGMEFVTHHGTPWVLLLLTLGIITLMWIVATGVTP